MSIPSYVMVYSYIYDLYTYSFTMHTFLITLFIDTIDKTNLLTFLEFIILTLMVCYMTN